MEKLELLGTAVRNGKCYSCRGKQLAVSQKMKQNHRTIQQFHFWYTPETTGK